MTPHRHWFKSYKPLRVPIRLANNHIVYSAGIGSVVFVPEVDGHILRPIEFTRVLHVPDLMSNLLSVLHLTRNHFFHVHIYSDRMDLALNGSILFCAPIDKSNTAYLSGAVSVPAQHALVTSTSTLPLDLSLWHRRLGRCQEAHLQTDGHWLETAVQLASRPHL